MKWGRALGSWYRVPMNLAKSNTCVSIPLPAAVEGDG